MNKLALLSLLTVGCFDFDKTPPPILSDYLDVVETNCGQFIELDLQHECWFQLCASRYQWNPNWETECREDAVMLAGGKEDE